jgi:hypothetical protein
MPGVTLTGTLMTRLGLIDVIDQTVKLAGRVGGANPGIKAATVVSALLAGADCIDDCDILRADASGQVCGHELRAPSTIGTWLRAFSWGMSANSTPQPDSCYSGRGLPALVPAQASRSPSTSTRRCARPTGCSNKVGATTRASITVAITRCWRGRRLRPGRIRPAA